MGRPPSDPRSSHHHHHHPPGKRRLSVQESPPIPFPVRDGPIYRHLGLLLGPPSLATTGSKEDSSTSIVPPSLHHRSQTPEDLESSSRPSEATIGFPVTDDDDDDLVRTAAQLLCQWLPAFESSVHYQEEEGTAQDIMTGMASRSRGVADLARAARTSPGHDSQVDPPPPPRAEAAAAAAAATAAATANLVGVVEQDNGGEKEADTVWMLPLFQTLLVQLATAQRIQDQLQSLRSTKCTLLQKRQRRQQPPPPPEKQRPASPRDLLPPPEPDSGIRASSSFPALESPPSAALHLTILRLLYRILAETALAYHTPLAERRALQAVLETLIGVFKSGDKTSTREEEPIPLQEAGPSAMPSWALKVATTLLRSLCSTPILDPQRMVKEDRPDPGGGQQQPEDQQHPRRDDEAVDDIAPLVGDWWQPMLSLTEALTVLPGMEQAVQSHTHLVCSFLDHSAQSLEQQFKADGVTVSGSSTASAAVGGHDDEQGTRGTFIFDTSRRTKQLVDLAVQWTGLCKAILPLVENGPGSMLLTSPPPDDATWDSTITTRGSQAQIARSMQGIHDFLWWLLRCPLLPPDALPVTGIALGRSLMLRISLVEDDHDQRSSRVAAMNLLDRAHESLSELPRAFALAGLAATVPDYDLVPGSGQHDALESTPGSSLLVVMTASLHGLALQAVDPEVRLAALKGFRTLVSRCLAIGNRGESAVDPTVLTPRRNSSELSSLCDMVLQVVLSAWENPPTRKLGNAIPALFETLVGLMRCLDGADAEESRGAKKIASPSLNKLVERLLAQPPNRKGRYLALEMLLPETGAHALLQAGGSTQSSSLALLEDLLSGIGDHGHNTAAIADLWAKLLSRLLQEMKDQVAPPAGTDVDVKSEDQVYVRKWLILWVPSLARSLVSGDLSRRRQVASFCLPRLESTVGGPAYRRWAELAASELLTQVVASEKVVTVECGRIERETRADRISWAVFEIIRLVDHQSVSKLFSGLWRETIASLVPMDWLRRALTHALSHIRQVAFQSMSSVVRAHHKEASSFDYACMEADLWKCTLPYAIKSDNQEYIASLVYCLVEFVDRLLASEAEATRVVAAESAESISSLPAYSTFVNDFLLNQCITRYGGYPGVVTDKEYSVLAILEVLIVFTARDQLFAKESKLLPKNSHVFVRRRQEAEDLAVAVSRRTLVSTEVLSTLMALLHSSWDGTRMSAFHVIVNVVLVARSYDLVLPTEFTAQQDRSTMFNRAIFLASSPRQRESDTGAKILAFLYLSLRKATERLDFMKSVVTLLESRLGIMKERLSRLLADEDDWSGGTLPLAHGIILSIRLAIENEPLLQDAERGVQEILERITFQFCRAIRLSLAVVADMNEGYVVEGLESCFEASRSQKINPGAIGANGIFSSVARVNEEESAKRISSQRIVVGSWLLTRETCGALAATITSPLAPAKLSLLEETGTLLISTLITLKHTGAAFAAHRAIQRIAEMIMGRSDCGTLAQRLPAAWVQRLFGEISSFDRVRDSTLRRSTGYALGFLSIMRSEISSTKGPYVLCQQVIRGILQLTLPPWNEVQTFIETIGLTLEGSELFSFDCTARGAPSRLDETVYQPRTRVHALNILRLAVLDAPLSKIVFPFVGDAVMSAIVGYTDADWSVRNSSTMVFSAAMLRVVDADKNASNVDATGSNAITISELFRSFPNLSQFLLAVMKGSVGGSLRSNLGSSLGPVLPILQLLARIQSVSTTGTDAIQLAEPFIPIVLKCLAHRNVVIRNGAARALANLSTTRKGSTTYRPALVSACGNMLGDGEGDWNERHGALLALNTLAVASSDAHEDVVFLVQTSRFFNQPFFDRNGWLMPAPCTTAALCLLEHAGMAEGAHDTLCAEILALLDSTVLSTIDVGISELASQAACMLTSSTSKKLWSHDATPIEFDTSCLRLSRIFQHNIFDVRVASVKAFKRSVYAGVDHLVLRDHSDAQCKLRALSRLLLDSLAAELCRNEASGSHSPTMRRLSRCIMEAMEGLERMEDMSSWDELRQESSRLGRLILSRSFKEDEDVPELFGNAVEMTSFATIGDNADPAILEADVRRLSHPSLHWRIRHSAARAIKRIVDSYVKKSQAPSLNSFLAFLDLLQDADPDVRLTASDCATSLANLSTDLVSEIVLARTYLEMAIVFEEEEFTNIFLMRVLLLGDNLIHQMQSLAVELRLTKRSDPDTSNTYTDRRIFEEEDSNPYEEVALTCQVGVLSLLRLPEVNCVSCDSELVFKILEICKSIVVGLALNGTEGDLTTDILHELTRNNLVFPALHSVLLASALIIFLHDSMPGQTAAAAKALQLKCEELVAMGATLAHPAILQVLTVLLASQSPGRDTYLGLIDCCFLIPRTITT